MPNEAMMSSLADQSDDAFPGSPPAGLKVADQERIDSDLMSATDLDDDHDQSHSIYTGMEESPTRQKVESLKHTEPQASIERPKLMERPPSSGMDGSGFSYRPAIKKSTNVNRQGQAQILTPSLPQESAARDEERSKVEKNQLSSNSIPRSLARQALILPLISTGIILTNF